MGLFINEGEHPDVFRNDDDLPDPNQGVTKIDEYTEMIQEQWRVNQALNRNVISLKKQLEQQELAQLRRWRTVRNQLSELKKSHYWQKKYEQHLMEKLRELDNKHTGLQQTLEAEAAFKVELRDHVNKVSLASEEMASQLEKILASNEQMAETLQEQVKQQEQLAGHMAKQEGQLSEYMKKQEDKISDFVVVHDEKIQEFMASQEGRLSELAAKQDAKISEYAAKHEDAQQDILNRLENQEALAEKILREVQHFRSILFERAHHLAEKIEDSYSLTSSYIHKLMSGSDLPLTFVVRKQKEPEKND